MVTLKELRKISGELGFTKKIESFGFSMGPDNFWFYRKRGDFIDVIQFWRVSNGNAVRVPVSVWIKELDDVKYDFDKFPKGFVKNRSNPSGLQLGDAKLEICYFDWWTSSDEEIIKSLNGIVKSIKSIAVPWFDNIDTKKALYWSLPERTREGPNANNLKESLLNSM